MSCKEDADWNTHVSKYLGLIVELASLGEQLSDDAKVSKLMRKLSSEFDPLVMANSFTEISLEALVRNVSIHVERRKNLNGNGVLEVNPIANMVDGFNSTTRDGFSRSINAGHERGTNGFGHARGIVCVNCFRGGRSVRGGHGGRGGRGGNYVAGNQAQTCHYCGKQGQFIKFVD